MAWTQADAQKLWPWLLPLTGPPGHVTQRFKGGYSGSGENGIDLGMPTGTPITSLTYGKVLATGYYGGGGVVSVDSTIPGIGVASVYYQHLDTIARQPGDVVNVGDLLGTSGGQLSGGHHPATCCSGGPHVEIGLNAPFGKQSIWRPLGPNVDPMPWLQQLVASGPPAADKIGTGLENTVGGTLLDFGVADATGFVRGTGTIADSFTSVEQAINYTMEGAPWGSPKPDGSGNWGDNNGVSNLWGMSDLPGYLAVNAIGWAFRITCLLIALIIIAAFLVNLLRPITNAVGPAAVGMAFGPASVPAAAAAGAAGAAVP